MLKLDFDERDLRSLRVFCAVAEAGGFTAAEKKLAMSKPSISRHVRDVEKRLGVRLCERGPGGFSLTPEGVVALDLASAAFQALGRIRPEIDAVHGVLSGKLAIGIGEHTLTHPDCKLPEALTEIRRLAPGVEPQVLVMTFAELRQSLNDGRVDLVIRGRYPDDRNVFHIPLYRETHKIYVKAGLKDADTTKLPLVYRQHPYVERAIQSGRYYRGPSVMGLDSVAAMVATGFYQGLLPTHYGDSISKRFDIMIDSKGPVYEHTGCAIFSTSRPLTQRTNAFIRILKKLHPFSEVS
ncbi:LysR family transcriptional regulator [Terrihabitans rhizophilus]|uniref:LysR family transcriptional regulator n=1 Tax=Terrihabitans rhizophilus TaxID=3092662 RepID=A0ABU4RQQ4_9HYPH|nr:LysR family transcriptional regulator [Terrihabitans sp. PJ23]MDX6805965.1 LysR family transcriptional regulator [Terrihabitans sp. PJ23]